MERTLVLVKPDGVRRKLVGEIISRLERANLKIVGLKLMKLSRETVLEHYPDDKEWLTKLGGKTLKTYEKVGKDAKQELGTDNPYEIGKMVRQWLVDYLTEGPVVAMVVKGNRVVEAVRKIVGDTMPINAMPGSIRGDFEVDSADLANAEKRSVYNLVHASDSVETAEKEIKRFFSDNETIE